MNVLAIDPGPEKSAYIYWPRGYFLLYGELHCEPDVAGMGTVPNKVLIEKLGDVFTCSNCDLVAIEMVACYGMAVGKDVFETCLTIGRFLERAEYFGMETQLVYRKDVKLWHCQSYRAKDSNIHQALVDKYGAPGTKRNPGVTYGITKHLWSALAIATFVLESQNVKTTKHDDNQTREIAQYERTGDSSG